VCTSGKSENDTRVFEPSRTTFTGYCIIAVTSFQPKRFLDSIHRTNRQFVTLSVHGKNGFSVTQSNQEMAAFAGRKTASSLLKPPLQLVACHDRV
jgi:hypothetical protein